ncbi:MAG: antibiotic biosynthesis monooxygenase family protein [Pseudomonadota bacterium]
MKQQIFAGMLALLPISAMAEGTAQITPQADVLTMINVWTPEEGKQAEFIEMLETALSGELIAQPGFVSGNIHRSLDSDHVVMYAQWANQEALEAFVAKLQSGKAPEMAAAFRAATPDFHPYAVTATGLGQEG